MHGNILKKTNHALRAMKYIFTHVLSMSTVCLPATAVLYDSRRSSIHGELDLPCVGRRQDTAVPPVPCMVLKYAPTCTCYRYY